LIYQNVTNATIFNHYTVYFVPAVAPEAKSKKNLCLYKSNVIWLPLLTTLVTLDCLVNEQDIMPSVALAVGFPISLCAHIRGFSMPWDTFKNIFKIVYFQ